MKSILMAFLFFFLPINTFALQAIPWVATLKANGSLKVPAGKVLIIQRVSCNYAASADTIFRISGSYPAGTPTISPASTLFDVSLNLGIIAQTSKVLNCPMQLHENTTLSNTKTYEYGLMGIMMDKADFNATVASNINCSN